MWLVLISMGDEVPLGVLNCCQNPMYSSEAKPPSPSAEPPHCRKPLPSKPNFGSPTQLVNQNLASPTLLVNLTLGSPSPLVNQTFASPGALQWEKVDAHFHCKIDARMDMATASECPDWHRLHKPWFTKAAGEANSWFAKPAGEPNSCRPNPLMNQTLCFAKPLLRKRLSYPK